MLTEQVILAVIGVVSAIVTSLLAPLIAILVIRRQTEKAKEERKTERIELEQIQQQRELERDKQNHDAFNTLREQFKSQVAISERLEVRNADLQRQYDDTLKEFRQTISRTQFLDGQVTELSRVIAEHKPQLARIPQLEQKARDMALELNTARETLDKLSRQLGEQDERLRHQSDLLIAERRVAKHDKEEHERERKQWQGEIDRLQSQIDRLSQNLEEKEKEITQLRTENADMKQQIERLNSIERNET